MKYLKSHHLHCFSSYIHVQHIILSFFFSYYLSCVWPPKRLIPGTVPFKLVLSYALSLLIIETTTHRA